jgi:hypothetical protein
MLGGDLCALNGIQSRKWKRNEELSAKLMAESDKLADKKTEKLH